MKTIQKGSIKYLIISTIAIMIAGIIIYPLFDLLYTKFITHSEFIYSVKEHIIKPIEIGFIMGICLWIFDKCIYKK